MYVAVKGGERAINNAHRLLAHRRRGPRGHAAVTTDQLRDQLSLAVARVMSEASLYDADLAALALKQASGDSVEAAFLLRAYRTTLPRLIDTCPVDTARMRVERRVSAIYKDVPGGQRLGPTYDYTHRLLDFMLMADGEDAAEPPMPERGEADDRPCPSILELLNDEGLIEREVDDGRMPFDITRDPPDFPVTDRATRLQMLARADEGYLLAIGYSTQRGYGRNHPFAGEIRIGAIEIEIELADFDEPVCIGEITLTECQMVNQFSGSRSRAPQFTRGYGLAFGHNERKAMAMSLVDRALRCAEFDEEQVSPAQDAEFVLAHADAIDASGFVSHLKLPHYVDFQAELELLRRMRREYAARTSEMAVTDESSAAPNTQESEA